MSTILYSLVSALLLSNGAFAVGTPFGYAAGTTGGGSASPAVPSSTAQLVSWLGDSTPRVILLDKTYDFTDSEGSVTAKACKPWTCSPNPQLAIDANEWCEHYEPNAAMTTVTYKKAGTTAIKVASNKTLLGKGTAGAIKGKGLRIAGGSNIIIQNIRISDINAQFVWGGDAISIDGGSKIWVRMTKTSIVYPLTAFIIELLIRLTITTQFKNVGRQFIVTGYGAAKSITISDNVFDGASTYSATCNGRHYWALLFTGASDSITLARNYLYQTSGRGPKLGGTSGYSQSVHIYNNYFVDISGHALDAGVGSNALVEGNYFNKVTEPSTSGTQGSVFAPNDATTAAQCSSHIGRKCVANTLLSSGTPNRKETGGVSTFKGVSAVTGATVMESSQVGTYVQAHAGLGKVN
ncbi:Pectate lyase [Rhizoctonia solani]|uniref:pectin lyase n=1 Tax=Rhizoctonia solani TaxID=456999 RepID=A0A8H7H5G4_9AGAM|nr:Pectate lyase [Rhizoctonia solani]KAF8757261.1 Pectate lyase [Rhizoctonia solani]